MNPSRQRPILTVTLNPALDLSAEVPRVVPGPKLRTGPVTAEPGGGGLNVARAVAELGGQVRALACLGGATGTRLASLLEGLAGLELVPLHIPGETRESLSVTEADSGAQYRFVLPGPEFSPEAGESLISDILEIVQPDAIVVLSGSQPVGLPEDLPGRLAGALPPGAELIVDTSGPPLTRLIRQPAAGSAPAILRLDAAEAQALADRPLERAADSARLAAGWVDRGVAGRVILARGAEGSVMVGPEGWTLCTPPAVKVVSAVGAGDSFVAGLALALARGRGAEAALELGTAAAAAAVTTPGTLLCLADDVARLLPGCRSTKLSPA